METCKRNKELLVKPKIKRISLDLTYEALKWLLGTTKDSSNGLILHIRILDDFISRMRLLEGKDYSFRRPKELQAFQFQFSEITLSKEWSIGRKKLHHLLLHMEELGMLKLEISRDSSICTVTCIKSIETQDGKEIFIPP